MRPNLPDAASLARPARRLAEELAGLHRRLEPSLGKAAATALYEHCFRAFPLPGGSPTPRVPAEVAAFIGSRRWSLDEADLGPKTVTPGLLAAAFEQSLRGAEGRARGAYYTPADVAAYVAESTLLPWLFDGPPGAVPLPMFAGLPPEARRQCVRAPLREPGFLARETPEERELRQARVRRTLAALDEGTLRTAADGVTWNLDLRRAAGLWLEHEPDPGRLRSLRERLRRVRVLDPTCGAGAFLLAALELLAPLLAACERRLGELGEPPAGGCWSRVLRDSLWGMDLMPEAAAFCRMRLELRACMEDGDAAAPGIREGDALAPSGPGDAPFDVVVGNPPYVGAEGRRPTGLPAYENLFAYFVEQAFARLRPEGRFGMVLPVSAACGPGYTPLLRHFLRGECWISTFSNRPDRLFPGVEQRLAIVLCGPGEPGRVQGTPYQHWWREERPHLLTRLEYGEVSRSPGTGMPAKTGAPLAEAVFRKVLAHRGRLIAAASPGAAAVWVHDAPTYWVRALPFPPNQGRGSGRSQHYRSYPVADPAAARAAAAVLSSSLFYFWFKAVSNCRDLGAAEVQGFPCDPLPRGLAKDLESLGHRLESHLRRTAQGARRVYPSGPVEYEIYRPAAALEVLDAVDALLAGHYGLTEPELGYVRGLDRKYRLGGGYGG